MKLKLMIELGESKGFRDTISAAKHQSRLLHNYLDTWVTDPEKSVLEQVFSLLDGGMCSRQNLFLALHSFRWMKASAVGKRLAIINGNDKFPLVSAGELEHSITAMTGIISDLENHIDCTRADMLKIQDSIHDFNSVMNAK